MGGVKLHTKILLAMGLGVLVGWGLQAFVEGGDVVVTVEKAGLTTEMSVLDPESSRAAALTPFVAIADVFMNLLKMLIVPLVLTSIVTGVAGIAGGREFGRLGVKTLGYYVMTSMLAIVTGLVLINLFQPGWVSEGEEPALALAIPETFDPGPGGGLSGILDRMVPDNVFSALGENGELLKIIVFALIFGYCIGRAASPHRERLSGLFESAFEVMMTVAALVLKLIPIGVFALVVKVVGETGFDAFRPLLTYMGVVFLALAFHAAVVLPLLLRTLGKVSPWQWFRAMSPALMTAFSTSSSSITLPVTMECVEKRGNVSNKHSSFVLPLGATVNMDGTALYECVGVIFLSQYYASVGDFDLTLGKQLFIVVTALLASIGAAGIPSAGLVMMTAILSALGLPTEGALLLLAIDRPLDMMRTMVNIWSDSCGAAIIARSEGDDVLAVPVPAGATLAAPEGGGEDAR